MKFNITERELDNYRTLLDYCVMSKTDSARAVGGRVRLEILISAGKIRAFKNKAIANSKWFCNARDVFDNARDCRKILERLGMRIRVNW